MSKIKILRSGTTVFSFEVLNNATILLGDLDKGMSITNNIEGVCFEILKQTGTDPMTMPVIYIDSEGMYNTVRAVRLPVGSYDCEFIATNLDSYRNALFAAVYHTREMYRDEEQMARLFEILMKRSGL